MQLDTRRRQRILWDTYIFIITWFSEILLDNVWDLQRPLINVKTEKKVLDVLLTQKS